MTEIHRVANAWNRAFHRLGDKAAHGAAHESAAAYDRSGIADAEAVAGIAPPDEYPTLIDFGCGSGRVTRYLADLYPTVVGVDSSMSAIVLAEIRCGSFDREPMFVHAEPARFVDLIDRDATLIGNIADVICSFGVLTHIPKPDLPSLFAEFARIVRPEGLVIFELPISDDSVSETVTKWDDDLPGGRNVWNRAEWRDAVMSPRWWARRTGRFPAGWHVLERLHGT